MAKKVMWTRRDGTEIAVADMTDDHLLNTMALCERVAEWKASQADLYNLGDIEDMILHEPEWFVHPAYKVMVDVAKARGLGLNQKV